MKHKLFKIHINTYYLGNDISKYVYVLADGYDEALEFIRKNHKYKNDEDAEIDEILEIAFETVGII